MPHFQVLLRHIRHASLHCVQRSESALLPRLRYAKHFFCFVIVPLSYVVARRYSIILLNNRCTCQGGDVRNRPEHKFFHQFLAVSIFLLGAIVVLHSLWLAIEDYKTLGSLNMIYSFLLEPTLSLLYTPYLYILVIVVAFDKTIVNLNSVFSTNRSPKLVTYAKYQIFLRLGWRPRRMWDFQDKYSRDLRRVNSKRAVDELIDRFELQLTKSF